VSPRRRIAARKGDAAMGVYFFGQSRGHLGVRVRVLGIDSQTCQDPVG